MNKDFNFELFERIKRRYGTYVRFQKETGVHNNLISMIINGWRRPNNQLKARIAKALDCKIEDIFSD